VSKLRETEPLFIVEDNAADFETILLLLSEAGLKAPVVHCRTGEEALQRIEKVRAQPPSGREVPAHILLDLNLPGLGGLDVLTDVRRDPLFASVPVTIFTTSSNPRDVEGCYHAGANSYLIKPVNFERMEKMLRGFASYWFDFVEYPEHRGGIRAGSTA
jgi:CheY-like chemotaxis protein